MMHPSNVKLNAAGLTPEDSMNLPERKPELDEMIIMQAVQEMYSLQGSPFPAQIFSPQVVFTMSSGDVSVGLTGLEGRAKAMKSASTSRPAVTTRILTTPSTLAPRSMCIDMTVATHDGTSTRTLLVIKRKASDGLVTSITEEIGHRKATAPLAARTASAGNFYSPTDNMLSPCTSKLNLAKKKHHLKGKPTTLFAAQMASKAPSQLSDDMDL
ncbi:hypothetical protein CBS101457_005360 [Exobasidium rhododendri]|nr:hypothetical protein CBS101457_005360 [Exobasidium rhododendri]